MSVDRSTILRGPGSVTHNSVQLFDKDEITLDWGLETFDVPVSAYGNVDTRRSDLTSRLQFTPCGRLTAGILGVLYPHGTPSIGSSLLTASDVATDVHSTAGVKYTLHASALVAMPSLSLSAKSTAFGGNAEIIALIRNNMDRTDTNSLFTRASEAWSGSFDVADIKGGAYIGTLSGGDGPYTIYTSDGWTVDFEMETEPVYVDGIGTVDMLLGDVTVRARCTPINFSPSDVTTEMRLQGADAGIGKSTRNSMTLTIAATGGLTVTLQEVSLVEGPMGWGKTRLRMGEIGFVASRKITAGVPAELFSVALT